MNGPLVSPLEAIPPPPTFHHSQSDDSFRTASSSLSAPVIARQATNRSRSQTPVSASAGGSRSGASGQESGGESTASERLELVLRKLAIETKIKDGAENLLQVLESDANGSERSALRREVETELLAADRKIADLNAELADLKSNPDVSRFLRKKASAQALSSGPSQIAPKLSARRFPSATAVKQAASLGDSFGSGARRRRESSPQQDEDYHTALSAARGHLASLSSLTALRHDVIQAGNLLVDDLRRNLRVRWELGRSGQNVDSVLDLLSEDVDMEVRSVGYRVLRWLLVDRDGWARLEDLGVGWYLLRTFTRDSKMAAEKTQALKLVRTVIELALTTFPSTSSGPGTTAGKGKARVRIPLSDTIIRTLVSVAENADDAFRPIVLETLAEIAIVDVHLLLRSNALRVLLQSFSEGPHDLAPSVALVLLFVADAPATRSALRPGSDIEMALSGFTDVYGSGETHLNRLKASHKVVSTLLRSWTGVIYLCMNAGIQSLIESLRIPSMSTRECLLDMFFEIFRIKLPSWYHAFLEDRRLTLYSKNLKAPSGSDGAGGEESQTSEKLNLVDHYVSFLLQIFLRAGLVDALIDVIEEADNILSRKATFLIGEVLALANRLLPGSIAADAQSLSRLFTHAARLDSPLQKNKAISALAAIHRLNRTRTNVQAATPPPPQSAKRARSNSTQDPLLRGQRHVESVKIRMGLQIDDRYFQMLLNDTGVLLSRDHTKWNFDAIMETIQGPLLNPRRLEEALKASKFGRRLLGFFQPLNLRFSAIKRTKPNLRWIRLGCTLMETLLVNADGIAFLMGDAFLPQLCDCLTELDQYQGTFKTDSFLSKERFAETLSFGYFEIFGTLNRHPDGIRLLERFKLYTLFYHLSDLRSREDIVKAIIDNLDYTTDGHSRVVLSKALTSSYMHIRLYATQRLGDLVISSHEVNEWTLKLLITQLYDPSSEVCEMAVHFLEEACESTAALELVVHMRPFLDHLGEMGHPLLLRFLSTSVGFQYLRKVHYLDQEMEVWFHERNQLYAVQVEAYISSVLFPDENEDPDDQVVFDGTAPPHFYGELTKTTEGCRMLEEKGHFAEFAQFIRQHGLEAADPDVINKLKSILWAVGSIGTTSGGFPFLENEDLLETIVEIAENSPVLSVRGTCFFILGLVSSTTAGADFLLDFGWEAALSSTGDPTGLCVPLDPAEFTFIPPWKPAELGEPGSFQIAPCTSALERSVLLAIGNLSNHVQASSSFAALYRLKRSHRQLFASVPLFYRALHVVSTNHHRLPIRRFLFELFDVRLTPDVVLALREAADTLRAPPSVTPVLPLPAGGPAAEVESLPDEGKLEAATFAPAISGQRGNTFSTLDVLGSTADSPVSVEGAEPAIVMAPKRRIEGGFLPLIRVGT